jgi:hypothetical protein
MVDTMSVKNDLYGIPAFTVFKISGFRDTAAATLPMGQLPN